MRENGRIVNVSSLASQLKHFHPDLQARFLKPNLTLTELNALVDEYSVRGFLSLLSFPLAANHVTLALPRSAHCGCIGLASVGLLHKQSRFECRNTNFGS
jgi:hypothetical protein